MNEYEDDKLREYAFDGDSDEEIEDLAKYRNEFEASIHFVSSGSYFCSLVEIHWLYGLLIAIVVKKRDHQ